jgi:basic membrane lipoprotein Med (substrate-binding protein (PBP1-ABC) superfamily)
VIKNLSEATVLGVKDALAGKSGDHSYGLADKGVSVVATWDDDKLAASQCLVKDSPEVVAAVRKAAQGIIDGSIVVKDPAAAK